jgi:hypothetical protein
MKDGLSRVTLGTAIDPYASRWRELRRRRLRAHIAAAACLIVSALGVFLLPSTITRLGLLILTVVMAAPFVFALGSYICPRCKKPFFDGSHQDQLNLLAKLCIHCGIAVRTTKADAGEQLGEQTIRILLEAASHHAKKIGASENIDAV